MFNSHCLLNANHFLIAAKPLHCIAESNLDVEMRALEGERVGMLFRRWWSSTIAWKVILNEWRRRRRRIIMYKRKMMSTRRGCSFTFSVCALDCFATCWPHFRVVHHHLNSFFFPWLSNTRPCVFLKWTIALQCCANNFFVCLSTQLGLNVFFV